MTRLFLRFYLGVILILLMAWFIQGFVLRARSQAENLQVVEQALSGGVRLAIARIKSGGQSTDSQDLRLIQSQFEYPVQLVNLAEQRLGSAVNARLQDGEIVFFSSVYGGFVIGALADREQGLLFGPLPRFVGPSQTEVTLGFGMVLLLAAVAIAILLRPVAKQLRAVEKTATAIAGGELSARIATGRRSKGLPLARAFNTMAERTEKLLNSQRELLQAVSHELRTPLARIRFAADLIGTASCDEERTSRLAAVDRATEELDQLVSELLTYVGMDAPDPNRTEESLELGELVADVVANIQPLFQHVTFTVKGGDAPINVVGDPVSLGRAVSNLIRNAGKFAKSKVEVDVLSDDNGHFIRVSDDGPGVPEEDRSRVFEPFVRLPDSPGRGSGLGLALVSRIVVQHHGHVCVTESEFGGAKFEIHLPAVLDD